jgi:hypothetical protein
MKPITGKAPASVFDWILELCRSAYADSTVIFAHILLRPRDGGYIESYVRGSHGVEGVVCIEDIRRRNA